MPHDLLDKGSVPFQAEGRLLTVLHKNILNLPVQYDLGNMPKDSYIQVQRVRADITGPNGFHYTSDWSATQTSHVRYSNCGNCTSVSRALSARI